MLAVLLVAFLGLAGAARAQQPYFPLTVDAGRVQGGIRFHTEAVLEPNRALGDDYAAYFEAYGDRMPDRVVIPLALGTPRPGLPADKAWVVFPDPGADPTDPASYDLRVAESILEAVTAHAPAVVRFDIGTSEDGSGGIAEAARLVALHLQQGRANGPSFGIEAWLVCGLEASPQGQYGTPLPEETSRNASSAGASAGAILEALQGVEPRLPVGLCLHWPDASPAANTARPNAPASYPPNFYRWAFPHDIRDASGPQRMAHQIRAWLNGSGGEGIDLRVLSPRFGFSQPGQTGSSDAEQAARLAAALIDLHDAPVAMIALDLWSEASHPGEGKQQAVLRAVAQLAETPHRLATEGGGSGGYALLAGRSEDRTAVQILIANHPPEPRAASAAPQSPTSPSASSNPAPPAVRVSAQENAQEDAEGYDLEVRNLPWGAADFSVSCYRVDQANNLELVWEGGGRGGSLRLHRQLPAQAVDLLLLQQRDRPVSDRMPRRRDRR